MILAPNRWVLQMQAFLAACRELVVHHNTLQELLYVCERKK